VELLRHPDGSLAIGIGGEDVPAFHWQAAEEERCVATFLGLVRR
jgi:hypothetical protein